MEILKNTILKLVYRQGSNVERKYIVFNSGEPVYTSDTERLYIGNGSLSGGKVASNLFLGSNTDITSFTNAEIGDLAFNNDEKNLYRLKYSSFSDLSSWENVGGVYTSTDNKIVITNNEISLDNNTVISELSSNWFDGSIKVRYDSSLSSFSTENVTNSTRLSAGHYRFTYSPIIETQIPIVQTINNLDTLLYPRTINNTLSSCDVVILSSNQITVDKDFILKIDY